MTPSWSPRSTATATVGLSYPSSLTGAHAVHCGQTGADARHVERSEPPAAACAAPCCGVSAIIRPPAAPSPEQPGHTRAAGRCPELIGRLLMDPGLPLRARVARRIVMPYAGRSAECPPHAGDTPAPTSRPFSARRASVPPLPLRWRDSAPLDRQPGNVHDATDRACRWLFTGRPTGQPLHPDALAALLDPASRPGRR